jgi:D-alanyl-D-alanine carboxypeptidase (penicillin-binding protein 5/6)
VALAVAALLAAPVAATAVTGPSTMPGADTVGGPLLASRGVVVTPLAGAAPLPAVDADTWLLADLTTGEVLAAKGAHTKVLPASTLKTLTVATLMPKLDKKQIVTATWAQARADGGHVGIVPGATYSVWDLWHGLLLPSANDAAAALADTYGGMAATVRDMQAMADHLQASDTTVKNDSGLDAKGQVSSAYDMALIARAALEIPDFRSVTKTFHYAFPGRPVKAGATRKSYQIYTQNRLLIHGYKGVIGGKTGFTSLAHRTYWGAATRGGHTLVVTLFQIHEPTETAARSLLNWGFANRAKVSPVGTLVAPVEAGSTGSTAGPSTSAVGGGGTTASGGTAAASSGGVAWKPVAAVVLVLALAAAGVLWWRRRGADRTPPRSGSHEPTGAAPPAVAAPAEAPPIPDVAPVPPVGVSATPAPAPPERPAPGGNVRIITPPGRPPTT